MPNPRLLGLSYSQCIRQNATKYNSIKRDILCNTVYSAGLCNIENFFSAVSCEWLIVGSITL